jgi:polygalacturonase
MLHQLLRREFLLGTAAAAVLRAARQFDVREFGAKADGVRLDTSAIQAAIDACSKAAGGTVIFPAGNYLSGTIVLKSRVALELDAGAVLRGSKNLADYPSHIPATRSFTDTYTEKSLIYAEKAESIFIQGRGTIDGQGAAFEGPYKVRPYLIRVIDCRDVSITGVTILDSPMWVQHYLGCERVNIRGITVRSRVNKNNDGIDIDGCTGVRISDCDIWSGDDAIVLKSTLDRPCRDVVIANCVLSTHCSALKLGTESNGGFQDIAISNCVIRETRLAGIAVEMVDGGVLERVSINNITMNGVGAPIFVRLGDRARPFVEGGPRPPVGKLRHVSISNIQADSAGRTGCAIAGIPGHAIEDLLLENIRLSFTGAGTAADFRREVAEKLDAYPEFSMFGVLPAYGLYCRHVKGLRLRGVVTAFDKPDARPAVICDDVERLELADCAFGNAAEADSTVRLIDTRDVWAHGCRTAGAIGAWMRVSGARSRHIRLSGNDLAEARRAIETSAEVPPDAARTE